MAARLFDAARRGQVDTLIELSNQNRTILADSKIISPSESLLHIAVKSGQLDFVRTLMSIDPGMAHETNDDGYRALDVAAILGDVEIVNTMLSLNRDLCRLKGRDNRTALHYAAMKGRVDVITGLRNVSVDSIDDVTVYGETAIHLAVKYHQFEVFTSLVEWAIDAVGKESIVNEGDGDGDTALHLAVLTRQYAFIEFLVHEDRGGITSVNATNLNGSTPLDFLDIQDSYDAKISRKLESSGAIRASTSAPVAIERLSNFTPASGQGQDARSRHVEDWFGYFKFQRQRDSPGDVRNALLIVAALIATVCFQSAINPPDGIFGNQKVKDNNQATPVGPPGPPPPPGFSAGTVSAVSSVSAILGSYLTAIFFLFANTLGLTASTCILIYLTMGFPFQRELHIALYSMTFTYGFAIGHSIKDVDAKEKVKAYVFLTVALVAPWAQRWLPRLGRRGWKLWSEPNLQGQP
ncbi:ankyrin repeat-containing protein At5g02620-like [Andrographis paniculata]|uniref:ankyrin repeat-containing protein At5g02620-like n=1 Tax=Andrographis paniculata TaxID=175694 RepID=UPI0021E8A886|nr:ankyrin repeat-containing protein At5g02620-like [Andrographis paniculata]